MTRREIRIKYGDQRKGDEFVRWADSLSNDREAYVLREMPALPTAVGSRIVDEHGTIFALSTSGMWISLRTGVGHEPRTIREMSWKHYGAPVATSNDLYELVVQMINRGGHFDRDEVNRIVDGLEESKYFVGREITFDEVHASVCKYADSVSRYNGITWLTEAGRRRFAEEIVKDLNKDRVE